MGPIVPCLANCDRGASRIFQDAGEVVAFFCTEHEWYFMRKIYQKHRNRIEAEKGWMKFCDERGYDPLATRWKDPASA